MYYVICTSGCIGNRLCLRRIGQLPSTVRVYGWNNITQNECHCITSITILFFLLLLTDHKNYTIENTKTSKLQNQTKTGKIQNKTVKCMWGCGMKSAVVLIYFVSFFGKYICFCVMRMLVGESEVRLDWAGASVTFGMVLGSTGGNEWQRTSQICFFGLCERERWEGNEEDRCENEVEKVKGWLGKVKR